MNQGEGQQKCEEVKIPEKNCLWKIFCGKIFFSIFFCAEQSEVADTLQRDERGEMERADNLSSKFGTENPLTDSEGLPGSS